MNVTVENLGPCKKLLRFQLEAKEVDEAFEATLKEYQRRVNLPGFRPGKAPREVVLRKYEKEVQDKTKHKLMVDNYRKGVQDQKLTVLGYPDFEEIQFKRGEGSEFAATVETAPEFELPEYRGLPAKREMATVSEADMERAFLALRTQQAGFRKADRPIQEGDIAVINYRGACEGKPITELAPVAKGLTEKKNFWIEIKPDSFIHGFAPQLLGARAGEHRTVTVNFAPDFITKEVAGKQGQYAVEIVEVKERVLPPLDEAFAHKYGAKDLHALREGVRRDLQNELNQRQRHSIRTQVVGALLGRAHVPDLPESMLLAETKNVAFQIVRDNEQRGISTEVIQQQQEAIYSTAAQTAKERVKADFLFGRIARQEGIAATAEEVTARIATLARTYNMTTQAFLKELEKRQGVAEIETQIVREKVSDFLAENARIEDVMPRS